MFDALSARLGPDLSAARVLDLFSGTGALSFEALSRGAVHAVTVESNPVALRAMRSNAQALRAEDAVTVIGGDALGAALSAATRCGPFSLLLADPPYRIEQVAVASVLERVAAAGALEPGAVVVVERSSSAEPPDPSGFVRLKDYRYGDTSLTFMRYGEEGGHE